MAGCGCAIRLYFLIEIFLDKRSVHEAAIIALHHEANASQIDIGEQIQ